MIQLWFQNFILMFLSGKASFNICKNTDSSSFGFWKHTGWDPKCRQVDCDTAVPLNYFSDPFSADCWRRSFPFCLCPSFSSEHKPGFATQAAVFNGTSDKAMPLERCFLLIGCPLPSCIASWPAHCLSPPFYQGNSQL